MSAARWGLCVLLALAAAGCAGGRPAGDGALVPLADLPEAQRAAWQAWLAGGAEWETRIESVRADPAVAQFVVDNLVRVMVQSYGRSRLAAAPGSDGPFERASADLVELAEHSTPVLVELLRAPDGVVALLAADRLTAIGARAVEPVARLLADERDETRRRSAELLERLPEPSGGAPAEAAVQARLAGALGRDPSWPVRAQCALALGARAGRSADAALRSQALAALVRALGDDDPAVVERAARALGPLGDPAAVARLADALERAAGAGEFALARAIEAALAAIAGDARRRTPAEWRRFRPRSGSGGG